MEVWLSNLTFPVGCGLCAWAVVHAMLWLGNLAQRTLQVRRHVLEKRRGLRESLNHVASSAMETTRSRRAWDGWRRFVVSRLEQEAIDSVSIYLTPEDGRSLPVFLPGQYLTFSLRIPGDIKPVVRCYSLSDSPHPDYYRCTVKEVASEICPSAPVVSERRKFGRASRYLNRDLRVGDVLDVKAPQGNFWLNPVGTKPAVLIGGGIGTTPLLSMLKTIVTGGSQRPVYLFLQFRNGEQHPFKVQWQKYVAGQPLVKMLVSYSQPLDRDLPGRDFNFIGRLNWDVIQKKLVSFDPKLIDEAEFYLCGPSEFMDTIATAMAHHGLPADRLHAESFGPSSVRPRKMNTLRTDPSSVSPPTPVQLTRSGQTFDWSPEYATLLELIEAQGILVDAGCRVGNCGTCMVALQSGNVCYVRDGASPCPPGGCLPCICKPDGAVALEI